MTKHRQAARIDKCQPGIVKALRAIPGVTVLTGHDDLLIGRKGRNYLIELKDPDKVSNVTGEVIPSAIKPSQYDLLANWKGQYDICWELGQILKIIGI